MTSLAIALAILGAAAAGLLAYWKGKRLVVRLLERRDDPRRLDQKAADAKAGRLQADADAWVASAYGRGRRARDFWAGMASGLMVAAAKIRAEEEATARPPADTDPGRPMPEFW